MYQSFFFILIIHFRTTYRSFLECAQNVYMLHSFSLWRSVGDYVISGHTFAAWVKIWLLHVQQFEWTLPREAISHVTGSSDSCQSPLTALCCACVCVSGECTATDHKQTVTPPVNLWISLTPVPAAGYEYTSTLSPLWHHSKAGRKTKGRTGALSQKVLEWNKQINFRYQLNWYL